MIIASKQSFLTEDMVNGYLHFADGAYLYIPFSATNKDKIQMQFLFEYYAINGNTSDYFMQQEGSNWFSFENNPDYKPYFNIGSTTFICQNILKMYLNNWYLLDFTINNYNINVSLSNQTNSTVVTANKNFSGSFSITNLYLSTYNTPSKDKTSKTNISYINIYKNDEPIYLLKATSKNKMKNSVDNEYYISPTGTTNFVKFNK